MGSPDSPPPLPAARVSALIDDDGRPRLDAETLRLRDLPAMALDIKFFGYELARLAAEGLPLRSDLAPRNVGLTSKPSTQSDLESDWAAYWCNELRIPVQFHRKIWEFVFLLQALSEHGMLAPDRRGLGFGCGEEPIPSYLANLGVHVLATDLAPEASQDRGWMGRGQHTSSLDMAFKPYLTSREAFDRRVNHRFVDMNAIPADLTGFDFCWSICALEHLGSIRQGLDFIQNSLATLRPGGVAVHTTEFNFLNDEETVDNWPTVLFQRKHFRELADRLTAAGHSVAPLDFNIGRGVLDQFIDIPPYEHDWSPEMMRQWGGKAQHLKLNIDGFASTCFGLIIRRGGA
ncbi:class I SAM-dependent methyltransferase [Segnochrobactrum spirostomi]|uniref:Class I SAM-dependent methyltransferase n=1 Tax=Segnochrobactrum spirostomi TaxID=2608987 RepID=A0A6A7Y7E4_9HYPH|nr:class I SAM-dependent methyltransferase [Segnochrobactrum spirostomi]MQT15270.1 class I SAM-dependent methyltransferase [Segnochrobactrum spirostomi]